MPGRWAVLDYAADRAVIETLHAYLQVVGKLPTRALPWINHGWHLALRVVPRGFRTYPVELPDGDGELLVDCLSGRMVFETTSGFTGAIPLDGQTVAELYADLSRLLAKAGATTSIDGLPNEVEPAVPFERDHRPRAWDLDTAQRIHRAFADAARVFGRFRAGFIGKASPPHLFWGSFDLAVTRFSGRAAPPHPGGLPNLPDRVTREAYSHEVASAGFWLGGSGVNEAAFYAYGYPSSPRLAAKHIEPADAYWHEELGEWVLPYAAVRAADDPEATLSRFLQSTYEAIAEAGDWPRADLEGPPARYGRPREIGAEPG